MFVDCTVKLFIVYYMAFVILTAEGTKQGNEDVANSLTCPPYVGSSLLLSTFYFSVCVGVGVDLVASPIY